ncbi:MAG: ATPase, T2SS/T4P/T4SS family [Patescibacteria group bacterium]
MPDKIQSNNMSSAGLPDNLLIGQSILDVFVLQNILDLEDAEKLKTTFKTNREIENFLLKNRLVTRETINKAYSILLKLPYISLRNVQIPKEALNLIPEKLVRKFGIIPFSVGETFVRIAISRPADLLARYPNSLVSFMKDKNLAIELFITGDIDFYDAVKQYSEKGKNELLIKRGSLPVVFLRNQIISDKFLKKLPKEFIKKYRLVVFGENRADEYLIASETPDVPLTQKIIDFIERENEVEVELFATSKDDIDYVIKLYDRDRTKKAELDIGYEKKEDKVVKAGGEKITLKGLLGSVLSGSLEPEFTIDEKPVLDQYKDEEKKPQDKEAREKEIISTTQVKQPVHLDETTAFEKPETEKKIEDKVLGEKLSAEKPKVFEQSERETAKDDKIDTETIDREIENEIKNPIKLKPSKKPEQEAVGKNLEEKDLSVMLGGKLITTENELQNIIKTGYIPNILAASISYGLAKRASDIHIEPETKHLRLRCRIDGILEDIALIPLEYHAPLVTRIKILSRLKIDENRIPQDGRFDLIFKNRKVDIRVSTLPTVNGEKAALRLLDKEEGVLSLEDLGMQGSAFQLTVAAIARPYGTILSTGPTGSGKTTTLYAILNRISRPGINIVTLEDPVEYEIPGINQCQIKPEIGFTFASGLRSVLRQDPNIIMVGEIRDAETAGMVTHSALTGHLVLSTLHTNDTSNTLPRLTNMGIEPFLITSSINLVIAQRLVRKVCPRCKEEMKVPPKILEQIKAELSTISPKNTIDAARVTRELRFYYGRGCNECLQGFRGRVGIFEVMDLNQEIEELAVSKRPANEIRVASIKNGMLTMRQDGILKVLAGITTIDEVFQATSGD